ncbi:MAG TPA: hypothetical protein VI215_06785 [Bacteroidota bacterium]
MTLRSSLALLFLVSACLTLASVRPASATGMGEAPHSKSNLEVMQSLLGRITQELLGHSRLHAGDTILFRMGAAEDGWIVQNALTASLASSGYPVFLRRDSVRQGGPSLLVHSAELRVMYEDMYHDGFLGTRKVRRTVSAAVTCELLRPETGELVYTGSPSAQSADTVAVDEVQGLELAAAKTTHGELPSESFLDRVLEPVVIIGATGVSIYLFFHVRS